MSVRVDSLLSGDDATFAIAGSGSGANGWKDMSFTTESNYTITSVKLLLLRVGLPGTLTVSIKATDGNGRPTGANLCSGTTNGSTLTTNAAGEWREITFGAGTPLKISTKYAICCVAYDAGTDYSKYVGWRCDNSSPPYSGGNGGYSSDGSTWSDYTADFMFDCWGILADATTVAATSKSWTSVSINGTIVHPSPTTQYGFVWDTVSHVATNNPPATAGYVNYSVSAVGSYTGNKTLQIGLLHPIIIYYKFGVLFTGTTWVYGAELTLEFGIYNPGYTSIIGHEVVWDGTYLYYSFESPAMTGYIVKLNRETMDVVLTWTAPSTYFCMGLGWNGTNLIASLFSYIGGNYAKLVKIQVSGMTTVATWTGDSTEDEGYFCYADATNGYIPMLSNKINKIQLSDMTEVDTYTNAGTNGFTCVFLYKGYLYVGGQTTGPPYKPTVIKLDSNMDFVAQFTPVNPENTYVTRVICEGDYIYLACGGSGGKSEIFKIAILDMSLVGTWTSEGTGIPDGSGAWGLIYQNSFLFTVACSAPTEVVQLDPGSMQTQGEWVAPVGQDGGDCICSDGRYYYVGQDDSPSRLFRMNKMSDIVGSGFVMFQDPGIA